MSGYDLILLLLSAGLLLLAHTVRAMRWRLLFASSYVGGRFNLLLSLGVSYAIDIAMPLRVGEIVRILMVRERNGLRFSLVGATVLVERLTDLLAVGLILGIGPWPGHIALPAAMLLAAAAGICTVLQVRRSLWFRQFIWRSASIFNDRIRSEIADLVWSAGEIMDSGIVLRWRFLSSSCAMWALYFGAYDVFSRAVHLPPFLAINALLNRPWNALVQNAAGANGGSALLLVVFAVLPLLAILLYGALRHHALLAFAWNALRRHGISAGGLHLAARKRFDAAKTYDVFLASLFTGTDDLMMGFGLGAADDCIIHKFYTGGSDAITALVGCGDQLMIRKFAVGQGAIKLAAQAAWLRRHGADKLPLVAVAAERDSAESFAYDMELITPANDFYEVIHTSPPPHGRALLAQVIEQMADFHRRTDCGAAEDAIIAAYLAEKATRNARLVLDFARALLPGQGFTLNGRKLNFAGWDCLFDPAWLERQVRHRRTAPIHGDLTIENIIIAPGLAPGFYAIDPNPDNIFNSPLIDWAKLMQSLHLGYETLNQGLSCEVRNGVMHLPHLRSQAYAELHGFLESEAIRLLGDDGLREIYFHEVINYLRLSTYKIRQSRMRGLGFYACTALLLDRYLARWG
jgi:hypothetical protein